MCVPALANAETRVSITANLERIGEQNSRDVLRPTPLEVETATFRHVVRGYDPDEVDTLLLRVAERYEAMWSENQKLRHRTAELEEAARKREDDDGLMTRVLTNAQAMADEIRASAQAEAEKTIEDARREAEDLRAQLDGRLRRAASEAEADEELSPGQRLAYRDLLLTTIEKLEVDAGTRPDPHQPLAAIPEHAALTSRQPEADRSEHQAE